MRKNILLHFLNRDAREVFGIDALPRAHRIRTLNRALNVAICLCEECCVMPPGFSLECEVAFEILRENQPYLDNGYIWLAQRESSIGQLIEKKRSEYSPARARFESLFNDAAVEFLRNASPRFVRRATRIGATATLNWLRGPDDADSWDRLKSALSPQAIDLLRKAPGQLLDKDVALIWPALAPLLTDELLRKAGDIRHSLQHNYFVLYVNEYELVVLSEIPHFIDEFDLPSESRRYSYARFSAVLRQLHLDALLDADSSTIVALRQKAGFTRFCDAVTQVFGLATSLPSVQAMLDQAIERSKFDWWRAAVVWKSSADSPARVTLEEGRLEELADGLDELSAALEDRFQLTLRSVSIPDPSGGHAQAEAHVLFSKTQRRRPVRTIVLATSNIREAQAVLDVVKDQSARLGKPCEYCSDAVLPRHTGALEGASGVLQTHVVRADETSGAEAVDLLRRVLIKLEPDCIFFVGCAALLDERTAPEANLVFVARRAIDSDKREEGTETDYDMEQHHGDLTLLRNIDTLNDGKAFAPLIVKTNRHFVSGSAFFRSRTASTRLGILKKFPADAAVLEMEAFAILKAVAKLRAEGVETRVAVVKGISDAGDESAQENKDQTQRVATTNALKVVLTLLRHLRD